MANNPIPEPIRRQVWDLLRPYKDVELVHIFGMGFKLEWILSHALGYDRGPSTTAAPQG